MAVELDKTYKEEFGLHLLVLHTLNQTYKGIISCINKPQTYKLMRVFAQECGFENPAHWVQALCSICLVQKYWAHSSLQLQIAMRM